MYGLVECAMRNYFIRPRSRAQEPCQNWHSDWCPIGSSSYHNSRSKGLQHGLTPPMASVSLYTFCTATFFNCTKLVTFPCATPRISPTGAVWHHLRDTVQTNPDTFDVRVETPWRVVPAGAQGTILRLHACLTEALLAISRLLLDAFADSVTCMA